jgi:hypothetical protein
VRLRTKVAIVGGAFLLAGGLAAGVGFSSRPSSPVPMCDAYPAKGQEPCSDQIERLRRHDLGRYCVGFCGPTCVRRPQVWAKLNR